MGEQRDRQQDELVQSALECWKAVRVLEDKLARQRGTKAGYKGLVDFTPAYWRKWQGDKRKAHADSLPLNHESASIRGRPRSKPSNTAVTTGPSLSYSSTHPRTKTYSFAAPREEDRHLAPDVAAPVDASVVERCGIDPASVKQYDAVVCADKRGLMEARAIPVVATAEGHKGVSFATAKRDGEVASRFGIGQQSPGPSAYDVRALQSVLPNHGNVVFGSSAAHVSTAGEERGTPGPGAYATTAAFARDAPACVFPRCGREGVRGRGWGKDDTPGPQHYDVMSVRAVGKGGAKYSFSKNKRYKARQCWVNKEGVEPMVGFGHACSFAEHVCYGRCLEGGCSMRAGWERTSAWLLRDDQEMNAFKVGLLARLTDAQSHLHFAVKRGELDVVDKILMGGLDPDTRDGHQRTALHHAAEKGDYRICRRLIENDRHASCTAKGYRHERLGASLDVQDVHGDSPMHLAARKGHETVLELLYRLGARHDLGNKKGATPLDDCATDVLYSKARYMLEIDATRAELEKVNARIERIRHRAKPTSTK